MGVFCLLSVFLLLGGTVVIGPVSAQTDDDLKAMFEEARGHFVVGEYKEAIKIYDDMLEIAPNNISTLKMKGIAQSNLEEHTSSLKQFFKVLQYRSTDVTALTGMGVGFGNLGEYKESISYFEKASVEKPDSVIINNYRDFINKVITKYPYTPTEKPQQWGGSLQSAAAIPEWIRTIAKGWSDGNIMDSEFESALIYLVERSIIQIPTEVIRNQSNERIPDWVKNNALWWADRQLDDKAFVSGIEYLIENGIIVISAGDQRQKFQEEIDEEFYIFEKYLRSISNNISKETRYIEYPNPSQDVIKKFLRDYIKWNYEEQVRGAAKNFPDPAYQIEDGTYIINYKVHINEQPTGLPLDHVSTMKNSFAFWESRELSVDNQNAKIKFEITNLKDEANVWVTWVVRNIGEGVLGHAHVGKGVVEVTLGDYNCDGSFQLYSVDSVETIMTHELGHSIGLSHTDDKSNIMYPSLAPSYAYCLLG